MSEYDVSTLGAGAAREATEFILENLEVNPDQEDPEKAEAVASCLTIAAVNIILYLREVLPPPRCHNVCALITGTADRLYAKMHQEQPNGGSQQQS